MSEKPPTSNGSNSANLSHTHSGDQDSFEPIGEGSYSLPPGIRIGEDQNGGFYLRDDSSKTPKIPDSQPDHGDNVERTSASDESRSLPESEEKVYPFPSNQPGPKFDDDDIPETYVRNIEEARLRAKAEDPYRKDAKTAKEMAERHILRAAEAEHMINAREAARDYGEVPIGKKEIFDKNTKKLEAALEEHDALFYQYLGKIQRYLKEAAEASESAVSKYNKLKEAYSGRVLSESESHEATSEDRLERMRSMALKNTAIDVIGIDSLRWAVNDCVGRSDTTQTPDGIAKEVVDLITKSEFLKNDLRTAAIYQYFDADDQRKRSSDYKDRIRHGLEACYQAGKLLIAGSPDGVKKAINGGKIDPVLSFDSPDPEEPSHSSTYTIEGIDEREIRLVQDGYKAIMRVLPDAIHERVEKMVSKN